MTFFSRAACAALALLLAGCAPSGAGEPAPGGEAGDSSPAASDIPDAVDGGQIYSIHLDGRTTLHFDAAGNEMPEQGDFTVLYDLLSGRPVCQKRTLTEDTGADDEYGNPVLRRTSALYDLEGNLLVDFAPVDYDAGVDDFLIRHDPRGFVVDISDLPADYHTELWNLRTGETVLDGVGHLSALDEAGERFLLTDYTGSLLGVMDRDGNAVSGFPPPGDYGYATPWQGMVIASDRPFDAPDPRDVLLTQELTPVASADTINGMFFGLHGPNLLVSEGGRTTVRDKEWQECYTVPLGESLDYFDGELAVLGLYPEDRQSEPSYRLVRAADGVELCGEYRELRCAQEDSNESPASHFLGLKGNVLELIDRGGAVTARRELPGIDSLTVLGGDLLTYRDQSGSEGLLRLPDLETLIEPGTYSWIQPLRDYSGGRVKTYPLFRCAYYALGGVEDGGGVQRFDVLDASLGTVATGLTSIDGVGPDRLAVVRGFSAGLMDWKGNWVVKRSIFQNFHDDVDEWGIY